MAKTIKIGLYQGYHGLGVPASMVEKIARRKPDILCLPEYFFIGQNELSILPSAEEHDAHLQYLIDLSIRLGCAITGGSILFKDNNRFKNRCYFIENGKILGYYDKIHPFKNEGTGHVSPGYEYKIFIYKNIRIGILICADVLYQSSFCNIKALKPELIIVPVTSPYKDGETKEEKYDRDEKLWVEGARVAGCPVIKVGSVGKIAGRKLQGRSLAASSDGIFFRVMPENEDKPVLKFLDLFL